LTGFEVIRMIVLSADQLEVLHQSFAVMASKAAAKVSAANQGTCGWGA
jgi:hypothetical protein